MHLFKIECRPITRRTFSTTADNCVESEHWFKSSIQLQEMSNVPSEKLQKRFDQAVKYVEQLHLRSIFDDGFDRLLMCTSRLRQCCFLRELSIYEHRNSERCEEGSPTKGDLLLDALMMVPSLERLRLEGLAFSCPNIVERFLAKSPRLRIFHLQTFKTSTHKVHQVADGFRRGIQLNQTLTEVLLVRPNGVEVLVYNDILLALIRHPVLQHLELQVMATSRNFKAVAERALIANTTSIKELRVEGDSIAAAEILHGLAQNRTIERFHARYHPGFNASDGEVDSRLASAVEDLFANNVHLRELNIEKFKLGTSTDQALAEGLSNMKGLQILNLSQTLLGDGSEVPYHACKLKRFALTEQGTLLHSDFSSFTTAGMSLYGNQFCLQELNFSGTSVSIESLGRLLFALDFDKAKEHLRKLDMGNCGLDGVSAHHLAAIIEKTELEELILSKNRFSVQGLRRILESVRTSAPSMKTLHLYDAFDREEEDENPDNFSSEVRALLEESSLVNFDISSPEQVGSVYMDAVAEGLRNNETMQKLLLPHSAPQGFYSIGQALTNNTTVTHLSFATELDDIDLSDVSFDSACSFFRLLGELKGLKELSCWFDWWDEDRMRSTWRYPCRQHEAQHHSRASRWI